MFLTQHRNNKTFGSTQDPNKSEICYVNFVMWNGEQSNHLAPWQVLAAFHKCNGFEQVQISDPRSQDTGAQADDPIHHIELLNVAQKLASSDKLNSRLGLVVLAITNTDI